MPSASGRLVVVLPHLGLGGAQRVASSLASHWAELGREVTLVTWLNHPPDFHAVHPSVRRVTLAEQSDLVARIYRRLANRLEPADVAGEGRSGPRRVRTGREIPDGMFVVVKWAYLQCRRVVNDATRTALFVFLARRRLLGRRGYPYAVLLRVGNWRIRALRRIIAGSQPDVVLSLLGATNIMTVAACSGLDLWTVISERNDPSKQRLQAPWDDLRPILYPAADVVTANSVGALESMRAYCPDQKLRLAPNPLAIGPHRDDGDRSSSVIFLARLVHQKAPDLVIDAFRRFVTAEPEWHLHLVGDGPMSDELQARVRSLGLEDDVTFHGALSDPTPLLAASRIFVLPSRFEGTPNALLEAMANRLACIVSDASPGPLTMVTAGVSGLVVEAERADRLANAMMQLARSPAMRRALGDAAFERVKEFGIEAVAPVWDRFLFPAEGGATS